MPWQRYDIFIYNCKVTYLKNYFIRSFYCVNADRRLITKPFLFLEVAPILVPTVANLLIVHVILSPLEMRSLYTQYIDLRINVWRCKAWCSFVLNVKFKHRLSLRRLMQ